MCASVSDLYGSNFGLTAEQIFQKNQQETNKCIDDNQRYQQKIKQDEIAGTPDFSSKNATIPPNVQPVSQNNSVYAKRPAWTDIHNMWPSNQDFNMFNRFQSIRENYSNGDHIISLLQEILLILKIIMLVLILLFVIKMFEKKN